MTAPADAPAAGAGFDDSFAVAFPPAWRLAAAALRLLARGTLVVTLWLMLFADYPPTNPLKQLRIFLGLIAAPELAAWCIARAFSARLKVRDGALEVAGRDATVEIPASAIAAVEPWLVPLPRPGLWLKLRSGRRFSLGIVVADPGALVEALVAAGAGAELRTAMAAPVPVYTEALRRTGAWWFDHPVFKFGIYSLVPTIPAFRLHQFITYGGTFGEYYTFGLKAYLIAFGLWWSSWAFNLMVVATVIRLAVEIAALAGVLAAPAWAVGTRRNLERFQRALYFGGIPTFLILRFWDW